MAHIIKAGYWYEKRKPLNAELDLDQWLSSKGITGGWNTTGSTTLTGNVTILPAGNDILFGNNAGSNVGLFETYADTSIGLFCTQIVLEGDNIFLTADGINVKDSNTITGETNSFPGLQYEIDLSTNFVDRSLVDKEYVDLAVSDKRLKKNITKIQEVTDKIMMLNPVEFDMIKNSEHKSGFIAQELQEIFPNLVKEGSNGFLKIKKDELIPYLVKCIQELKKEINEIKNGNLS